jgi:hypothetical protein
LPTVTPLSIPEIVNEIGLDRDWLELRDVFDVDLLGDDFEPGPAPVGSFPESALHRPTHPDSLSFER